MYGNLWRLTAELSRVSLPPRPNQPTITIRQGDEMLNFTNQLVIPEMNDSVSTHLWGV